MVKISIIMPLFNAETYLEEALHSIQAQTFQEYELICVNDNSTDATPDILHRFQSRDNRIRIINNTQHSGAAVSRNQGMRQAKGTYITFLDGDDIFHEKMLQQAYHEISQWDADILMFEYIHAPSQIIYQKKQIQRSRLFIEKYCTGTFSIASFQPIEFMNWSCSPCNKLYKKSFLQTNNLEFQTLSSANDMYFVTMALLLAPKIKMLSDRYAMLYARDHNTTTRISYKRDPMCTYWAMEKLGKELVERKLFHKLYQYYYCILFYNLRNTILKTKATQDAAQFYQFLKTEGIDKTIALSKECYQKTDKIIQKNLQNFKTLDFGSRWYQNEEIIKYYLYKNKEKIQSLLQTYKNNNQPITIWGAGKNGTILLEFLTAHNIPFTEVVDNDPKKQGTCISGYVIKKPDCSLSKTKVILASSTLIFNEIAILLQKTDIKIINIQELIEMP